MTDFQSFRTAVLED